MPLAGGCAGGSGRRRRGTVPVCVVPCGSAVVSAISPGGCRRARRRGARRRRRGPRRWLAPGALTFTVPATGATTTVLPSTGVGGGGAGAGAGSGAGADRGGDRRGRRSRREGLVVAGDEEGAVAGEEAVVVDRPGRQAADRCGDGPRAVVGRRERGDRRVGQLVARRRAVLEGVVGQGALRPDDAVEGRRRVGDGRSRRRPDRVGSASAAAGARALRPSGQRGRRAEERTGERVHKGLHRLPGRETLSPVDRRALAGGAREVAVTRRGRGRCGACAGRARQPRPV